MGAAGLTRALRLVVLVLLVAAPLAVGSVHPPAYVPLLSAVFVVGVLSWAHGHWLRAHGASSPGVPGRGLLLGLHVLVALQLVPLPPALLRALSPGSFAFRDEPSLVPVTAWYPVSVSPPDTLRGLVFLAGMSLLYAAVFREFHEARWRRRLAATVVGTGCAVALLGLLQAATGDTKIYGLWRPRWDFAVYGPYVNRNHFAGYLVLAIPLALAFAAEGALGLRRAWERRRPGWLALGETEANVAIRWAAIAMTLLVGLLAAQSRGGFAAFAASAVVLPLVFRQRRLAAAVVLTVAVLGVSWVGLGGLAEGFERRGFRGSRLELWADALRMWPRFAVFGSGFNAFGTAYPSYQTFFRELWWGETDNEYLQVVVDTGVAGSAVAAGLLVVLFRGAARAARRGALEAGLLGALVGAAVSNVVESNWQIPANAATFAALAGLASRGAENLHLEPPLKST